MHTHKIVPFFIAVAFAIPAQANLRVVANATPEEIQLFCPFFPAASIERQPNGWMVKATGMFRTVFDPQVTGKGWEINDQQVNATCGLTWSGDYVHHSFSYSHRQGTSSSSFSVPLIEHSGWRAPADHVLAKMTYFKVN